MKILSLLSFVFFALILCAAQAIAATTLPKGAVLTWHDDNFRTGWQQQETILTTSTASQLAISHAVTLKDQVDAQPLVIPGFINSHDIVFVADEANNVYQIDANTGAILGEVNLGAPVPKPLNCSNNGSNVGINSTPVIDWASQTLFVIAYVNVNNTTPTYFLHALNLTTLNDKGSPLQVTASHPATDGAAFLFNATNERQRAALLFANGNVYAAFRASATFTPALPTRQATRRAAGFWDGAGSERLSRSFRQTNSSTGKAGRRDPALPWTQSGCPAPAQRVTSREI